MRAPASGSAAHTRTGRRIRTTRNACPQRTERRAETADDRSRPRPPKPLTGVQAMMTHRTGSAPELAQQMPGNASEALTNQALLPTTPAQRHWNWKDFAALWVGMAVCVPTYTMASSMLDQGFSWQMAGWLGFLAHCLAPVPVLLIR